jgi:hypothetical protein
VTGQDVHSRDDAEWPPRERSVAAAHELCVARHVADRLEDHDHLRLRDLQPLTAIEHPSVSLVTQTPVVSSF